MENFLFDRGRDGVLSGLVMKWELKTKLSNGNQREYQVKHFKSSSKKKVLPKVIIILLMQTHNNSHAKYGEK